MYRTADGRQHINAGDLARVSVRTFGAEALPLWVVRALLAGRPLSGEPISIPRGRGIDELCPAQFVPRADLCPETRSEVFPGTAAALNVGQGR